MELHGVRCWSSGISRFREGARVERGRARGIAHDKISSDFLNQKIKRIVKKDSHSEDGLHGESWDCNIVCLKTSSQK